MSLKEKKEEKQPASQSIRVIYVNVEFFCVLYVNHLIILMIKSLLFIKNYYRYLTSDLSFHNVHTTHLKHLYENVVDFNI